MRRQLAVSAAAAAVAVVSALGFAGDARASECGVAFDYYERKPLVADIGMRPVLDALESGDAAGVVTLARGKLNTASLAKALKAKRVRTGRAFGEDEVRAALAVAIVRLDGAQGIERAARNKAERAKNLAQARDLLQQLTRLHAGDPVIATYLGEALVATGDHGRAADLLEDLASADLIVSAEGWAALAQARAASDDAAVVAAAADAVKRCHAMAREEAASAVCTLPNPDELRLASQKARARARS